MTADLVTLVQAIVSDMLQGFRTAELGVITAVHSHSSAGDKNNYECDVKLRDSELELKRIPLATQRVGAVAIPNVDDLVLVQYLNGDVHSAVVTGRFYNDQVRPPEASEREFVYISPDDQESGTRRLYAELPNNNKLLIEDAQLVIEMGRTPLTMKNDGEVVLRSNDQNITISDQNGSNEVKIEVQAGEVTVKAAGKAVVDAPQIELVDGAGHPLVFGDSLLQYLNQVVSMYQSHVHPGEMALGAFPVTPAPPVPPLPPATPDLLSLRVKTG
jgi:phage baseplate assembly protein gpV